MNLLRLLPVILSFGLLAAHFSRAGLLSLMILSLVIPFLLLIRKPWIARSIQLFLLLGSFEWVRAMLGYIEVRKAIGDDWGRLAIILIVVALLTSLSGLVFYGKSLRKRFNPEESNK